MLLTVKCRKVKANSNGAHEGPAQLCIRHTGDPMIPLSARSLCQEIKQQTVSGWMDSDGYLFT